MSQSDFEQFKEVEKEQHPGACPCQLCERLRKVRLPAQLMTLPGPLRDPLEESLSAIRDAITSRDRHFDALTEQLRQGFQAVQRQTEEDRAAVQGQIEALGAQLEGIERKQDSIATQMFLVTLEGIKQTQVEQAKHYKNLRFKAGAGRKKAKR